MRIERPRCCAGCREREAARSAAVVAAAVWTAHRSGSIRLAVAEQKGARAAQAVGQAIGLGHDGSSARWQVALIKTGLCCAIVNGA